MKAYQDRLRSPDRLLRKRAPGRFFLLQWHITERCNNRCSHCYQELPVSEELTCETLLNVADQFAEFVVARGGHKGHINVTGGEPFLRNDLMDFLAELASRRHVLSFAVLSNGTLIDGKTARALSLIGPTFVQVSVDGDEATHDHIRGPGDYKRAVSAMRHLVANGVDTIISFTASRDNYKTFGSVVRLGVALGVSRVWTDRYIPLGQSPQTDEKVLSPLETRQFLHDIAAKKREIERNPFCRTEIAAGRALQFLAGNGEPYRCAAGGSLITIMANGDLVPCRRMPVKAGNVMTQAIGAIYDESPFLQTLREKNRTGKGCEGCFYEHLCRGGLRCLSYALTGDPFRKDPGCWIENGQLLTGYQHITERGMYGQRH